MKFKELKIEGAAHGTAVVGADELRLMAGPRTDWFFHPGNGMRKDNVILAAKEVEAPVFTLSARVTVDFSSTFDAGALVVQVDEDNWAKLALEQSGAGLPTVVSVITRGTSDDADGPSVQGNSLWLRVHCDGRTLVFHFSEDGSYWRFLRWFTLPDIQRRPLRVGFAAQAPTGPGCGVRFSELRWDLELIGDLRNGS